MLEVGKVYKLNSTSYKNLELFSSTTYEHISIEIKNYFLLLEIDSTDEGIKAICLKNAKIFKILFDAKVYYLPIYNEFLLKNHDRTIEFVEVAS